MTESIAISSALLATVTNHLAGDTEQVGFFHANYDIEGHRFELEDWFPMSTDQFAVQSDYHVTLHDNVRPTLIKTAWDSGLSLGEVHSHVGDRPAEFSWSDITGLNEWVPHVRRRLRGRPYFAVVVGGNSFDALAWTDSSTQPVQVNAILVADQPPLLATGRTIDHWNNETAARSRHDR
jgi:hypothetical protein